MSASVCPNVSARPSARECPPAKQGWPAGWLAGWLAGGRIIDARFKCCLLAVEQ